MDAAPSPGTLALVARNVPRYTSYPTAPHFSTAVNAEVYGRWLRELPADATISLYIHVPFCPEMCHYCGCTTRAVQRFDPVERYATRLFDEIALLEGLRGRKLTRIHWGGGTPSLLGPLWLPAVAERIAALFDRSALVEHAIELDPRRLDPEIVAALAKIGITRASLGVQDTSAHVQEAIGRIQPFELVEQAAHWLREAGIANLNIDLMYGLPHQTVDDVRNSATQAASLKPQRFALFGYAHVPWFKTHQRLIDEAALPDAAMRLRQAQTAAQTLASFGYESICLDHFARPDDDLAVAARSGRLRRNFQGYTTDDADALIGLGASAIGKLPQGYVQNARDTAGYSRAVAAGRFATVKGLALSAEDRLRADIIERLMCDMTVDLARYGGDAAFTAERAALVPLVEEGLVALDRDTVTVTEKGRPYARIAAAAFDAYLAAGTGRHSAAV